MDVIDYGLDWLTLTNTLSSKNNPGSLIAHFSRLSAVTSKWSSMGYKGHQDKDRGIKYGSRSRKDGRVDEMLVMSGGGSEAMTDGFRGMLAYRATRVDIQITIKLDDLDEGIANRQYEKMVNQQSLGHTPVGRRKISCLRSETGSTLYVGKRASGRKFLRFYDKSDGYGCPLGLIWRQEVQYGRELAQPAMERYEQLRGDRTAITNLVSAEFHDCAGFSLYEATKQVDGIRPSPEHKETTLEAKLDWLERCVKPTIAALIEHDLEDEMLKALGLASIVNCEKIRKLDEHR